MNTVFILVLLFTAPGVDHLVVAYDKTIFSSIEDCSSAGEHRIETGRKSVLFVTGRCIEMPKNMLPGKDD